MSLKSNKPMIFVGSSNLALSMMCHVIPPQAYKFLRSKSMQPNWKFLDNQAALVYGQGLTLILLS